MTSTNAERLMSVPRTNTHGGHRKFVSTPNVIGEMFSISVQVGEPTKSSFKIHVHISMYTQNKSKSRVHTARRESVAVRMGKSTRSDCPCCITHTGGCPSSKKHGNRSARWNNRITHSLHQSRPGSRVIDMPSEDEHLLDRALVALMNLHRGIPTNQKGTRTEKRPAIDDLDHRQVRYLSLWIGKNSQPTCPPASLLGLLVFVARVPVSVCLDT